MSLLGKQFDITVADGRCTYEVIDEAWEIDGHRAPGGVVKLKLVDDYMGGHGLIEKMDRIVPARAIGDMVAHTEAIRRAFAD